MHAYVRSGSPDRVDASFGPTIACQARAMIEVHQPLFFLNTTSQFGGLRPLPKTDLEKVQNGYRMNNPMASRYTSRIMKKEKNWPIFLRRFWVNAFTTGNRFLGGKNYLQLV